MQQQGNQNRGHHEGRGDDFHAACMKAYEAAREAGLQPPYVISEIHLEGSNPFDSFLVKVTPK